MADNTALVQKNRAEQTTPETTWGGAYFTPRVDILETADELTLFADLPGVRAEDLDIRYENGELLVHGKVRPRQSGNQMWLNEYEVGDFYRAFTISESIDSNSISAECKNGVLLVHLPKMEHVKPKQITVRGA
jgi:HSP20 family molecular chaperone IbpA